jgi:hypothetical protein
MVEILAAAAVAVAWLIFRLERYGTRERELRTASGILRAVRRGMVEGEGNLAGWGEVYFSTAYTPQVAAKRALEAARVLQEGVFEQVLAVPTEPLEVLATAPAGAGLISDETILAANFGLWRVRVFNQLVLQQTMFNALHVAEIAEPSTPTPRRETLAKAAEHISRILHQDGIGSASASGGWYERLRTSLSTDIQRLDREHGFRRYYRSEPVFAAIDLLAVGGLVVTSVAA